MARFSISNRIAHAQMTYVDTRKKRKPATQNAEQSLFRCIGFGNATI